MKGYLTFTIGLAFFTAHGQTPTLLKPGITVDIFNGKNLDGWYQISDGVTSDKELFMVDEGSIHAYPTQAENS